MSANISSLELKKLWAPSQNLCAFPGCSAPLVDRDHGVVLAEMCHIRAQKAGGPRYDADYSAELLDTAVNLVLMCPTHHTLIDKAVDRYSVEMLEQMKADHEGQSTGPLPDDLFARLESALIGTSVATINVTSIGQRGGQTAAIIQNQFGRPERSFQGDTRALTAALSAMAPRKTIVSAETGAGDAVGLQREILQVLTSLGWETATVTGMRVPAADGIQVKVAGQGTKAELDLANVFAARGWRVAAFENQRLMVEAQLEIHIGLP